MAAPFEGSAKASAPPPSLRQIPSASICHRPWERRVKDGCGCREGMRRTADQLSYADRPRE
eukprot:5963594-Prymnesium_polylepis.1